MARVHFRGIRYGVRMPALISSLRVYCGMGDAEAREFARRVVEGERLQVFTEDTEAAYTLAMEMVDLGVNAEADESDD